MDALILSSLAVLCFSGIFALIGLGGSSIYVPIFFFLGYPLETAVPAGLLLNAITSGTATFNYRRLLDFKVAMWMAAGAIIGAPLGALLSTILPSNVIIGIFSLVLSIGALRMLLWRPHAPKSMPRIASSKATSPSSIVEKGAAGGATGIISGLLGVGGGIFLVPLLIESHVPPKKASMLSHPVVFFASLTGLIAHLSFFPSLDFGSMLYTSLAALIGAFIGSWKMAQSKHINDDFIKKAFALLLFIFAIRLALAFFGF